MNIEKQDPALAVRRIRRLSRVLRDLCWLALLLFVALMVLGWSLGSIQFGVVQAEFASEPVSQALGRPIAWLAHLPGMVSVVLALLSAARLFGCFERGQIFTAASVVHLARFSWSALAATVAGLLIVPIALALAALSGQTPATPLQASIEGRDFAALLLCAMLVVLSRVLVLAKRAVDDLELII